MKMFPYRIRLRVLMFIVSALYQAAPSIINIPCGPNARRIFGIRRCLYRGDPHMGYYIKCVISADCAHNRVCVRNKCKDPCEDKTCGQNALCSVYNYVPVCVCLAGMTGDPLFQCSVVLEDSCLPCGPNSICRKNNGELMCSCVPGFLGTPPSCRPECTVHSECLPTEACINEKCINPCLGVCGIQATCQVINHMPVCSCGTSLTGESFIQCVDNVTRLKQSAMQSSRQPISIAEKRKCYCPTDFTGDAFRECIPKPRKPIPLLALSESHHSLKQSTAFHCEVISLLPSNVTWSFLRCPNYPSFENTTTVYLTDVTQKVAYTSFYKIKSMVEMPVEISGQIKCEGCNTLGCDSKSETILVSDGLGALGIIGPRESVVPGDNIELICAASVYNYINNFTWTVHVNQTEKPVNETERLKLVQHKTEFTYRSTLKLSNVQKSDAQNYFCTVKIKATPNQEIINSLPKRATYTLFIYDVILPFFTNTNMNRSKTRNINMITEGHITVILQCFADGIPKPTVTWYKDNMLLKENDQYLIKYNYQELHIKYFMPHDSGIYSCRAISREGTNETYQQIMVKYTKWYTFDIILVTLLPILGFILVILVIFITIVICRKKKMRKELVPDLLNFDGDTLENLNPNSTVKDQAQFLPYDKKWEFPRERLKLGEQLGSGYFGVVIKAKALGMCKNKTVTTVAVKTVRRSDNPIYIHALVSELKIMVHLGKHLNVVNLLGACTKNILKGELLVIIEYCHFGNLHKYLLSHRSNFISQIDSTTGKFDLSIGADILKTIANVGNDSSAKNTDVVQDYPETNPDSSEVNILSECTTNNDEHFKPICTQDLLSWSFQVARGMEYLSQRKVLHGDLAARNILLAEDNVVKICDFGLAKDMYKDYYKKNGNAPVPVKWMAIESIGDHVFSTQSDVWSFGIMLWEFFTLAKVPYPGIVAEKLYQKLIEGYRMEQPDYATREIYDIMLQCWEAKPASRPSFTNLVESVGNLLEESVRMHYISLNNPYMDMNEKNFKTGKKDYLMMMSAPDHAVLSFSGHKCENSQLSKDISNSSHLHVNPGSKDEFEIFNPNPIQDRSHIEFPLPELDCEDTLELFPILNHEEDTYLKPINVYEKRVEFILRRQTMKDQMVNRTEQNSVYCNVPRNSLDKFDQHEQK